MAKGNPTQGATGNNSTSAGAAIANQAASSSNTQANQASNPSSVVTDNNYNLEISFTKEDQNNKYVSKINQNETKGKGASNNSHNTLIDYKGSAKDSTFTMDLNIGEKKSSCIIQ